MIQAKLFLDSGTSTGGSKIPVGIHQGTVVFSGLTTDQNWTDILFTEPTTGRTIHKRLFAPTGNRPKEGETVLDAKNREQSNRLGQLSNLLLAIVGSEVVETFEASDYTEFVAKASALLNQYKNVPVNLKVVPDYKEKMYSDLPDFGSYVEKHEVGSETRLKFSAKETAAISEMEQNIATKLKSGEGGMSSEDLQSLV